MRGAIKIRFRWSVVVNSEYILERPGAYTFVHLLKLGFHHLFKATKLVAEPGKGSRSFWESLDPGTV